MKILQVGIKNYRSIGEQPVYVDFRQKINLLIGANNCGKSNVLRALELISRKERPFKSLTETDRFQRKGDLESGFVFEMGPEESDQEQLKVLSACSVAWVRKGAEGDVTDADLAEKFDFNRFHGVMRETMGQYFAHKPSEGDLKKWAKMISAKLLHNSLSRFPEVVVIPQFRQIIGGDQYSLEGRGIVRLLASWQHPEIGKDGDREKFQKIESLLRRLLEMPNVSLEVSHLQDHILVANDGLRLPLEAYGTGIHELIIIAIAVLSKENVIFCIEEPEIHLHPVLQKRLIDFLRRETTNQYVITTHSPALITPRDDTAIIHLWLENGVTKSRQVETTAHSLQVLHDLGAQASDLLQANSAIWVEGPSDRVYLNAWLRILDPGLREGIDYCIMFYGGRLLSHLSMERDGEEDAEDLIKLLRINQHSAILIDSDKSMATDDINKTKQRIKEECEKSGVLCWITAGREIENYLPTTAVAKAYKEIAGTQPELKVGKFTRLEKSLEKAFGDEWKPSLSYDTAKPERARAISQHFDAAALDEDLKKSLQQLIAVIKHQR